MRYDANIAAFGEANQAKIKNQRVMIDGLSSATEYAFLNLVGLGVQEFQIYEPSTPAYTSLLARLAKPQEEFAKTISEAIKQYFPYISCQVMCSEPHNFLVEEFDPTIRISSADFDYGTHTFHIGKKGTTTTQPIYVHAINGSLLADQKRKELFLHADQESTTPPVWSLNKANLFNSAQLIHKQNPPKNIGIVGAGGIGTYAATTATLCDSNVTLYDFDIVEESNINRQLFYAPYIGRPKAQSLVFTLNKLNKRGDYQAVNEKIDEKTVEKLKQHDLIMVCTDNFISRHIISEFSARHKIPLIEGACSTTAATVTQYIPGLSDTVHKQRNLEYLSKNETTKTTQSCFSQANPSVVVPNCIAGQLMCLYSNPRFGLDGRQVALEGILRYNSLAKKTFGLER